MRLHFSTTPFQSLYAAIQNENYDAQIIYMNLLKDDLLNVLVHPEKNPTSRKSVESGKAVFTDGSQFELNDQFKATALKLSDRLNLDELIAAETLFYASKDESGRLGMQFLDLGLAAYHTRRLYILQIVSYYVCRGIIVCDNGELECTISKSLDDASSHFRKIISVQSPKLLDSFIQIENELRATSQFVERSKLLGTYYLGGPIAHGVEYCRGSLYRQYQILGEIYWGITGIQDCKSDNGHNGQSFNSSSFVCFSKFFNHLLSMKIEDIFSLCILPGVLRHITCLESWQDADIATFHAIVIKDTLDTTKLASSPLKAFIFTHFLSHFIPWCKKSSSRSKKYPFEKSVAIPLRNCISIGGALEYIMNVCAETRVRDPSFRLFYDFRALLQRHVPRLVPLLLEDEQDSSSSTGNGKGNSSNSVLSNFANTTATGNMNITAEPFNTQGRSIREKELFFLYRKNHLSLRTSEFLAPVFAEFALSFIENSAFILTEMRDMEEDLLLSSDHPDLDSMADSADLERFYMTVYYIFNGRPELGSVFWQHTSDGNISSAYGFLQWGSHCNSPLIVSVFCVLLSALSCGPQNAVQAFNFLQITNDVSDIDDANAKASPIGGERGCFSILGKLSCVSWATIYTSIAQYNKELTGKIMDSDNTGINNNSNTSPNIFSTLSSSSVTASNRVTKNSTKASVLSIPEGSMVLRRRLGEDSIFFLAGLFQLLESVAKNSSQARSGLLSSDDYQLLKLLSRFLFASTPLCGAALSVMASLVGPLYTERQMFWKILDEWLFTYQFSNSHVSKRAQDVILEKLSSYEDILGFVRLLRALLKPKHGSSFKGLELQFPSDLGYRVHRPGVSCYLEVTVNILKQTEKSTLGINKKVVVELIILDLWVECISQISPDLSKSSNAAGITDMDNLVVGKSIVNYLQEHPGSLMLCLACDSSLYDVLFSISHAGIDVINSLPDTSPTVLLTNQCINLMSILLDRQTFLVDELLPVLRLSGNKYFDESLISRVSSSDGLASLHQALMLDITLVTDVSLYISSGKSDLARNCLQLIARLSIDLVFVNEISTSLLCSNRLLTLYETIDDSRRIRLGFIQQFESHGSINSRVDADLKLEILEYLVCDLINRGANKPCVSHFLLGFDTSRMVLGSVSDTNLGDSQDMGSILSPRSLLKSIVLALIETAKLLYSNEGSSFYFISVRFCSLASRLLFLLCDNPLIGPCVLDWLRQVGGIDNSCILSLVTFTSKVYKDQLWEGRYFDPNFSSENAFLQSDNGISLATLAAFTEYRFYLIRLLILELHSVFTSGSVTWPKRYFDVMINQSSSMGSSRLFDMLDILQFEAQNSVKTPDPLFTKFDFAYILNRIRCEHSIFNVPLAGHYDLSIVDNLVDLYCKEAHSIGIVQQDEMKDGLALLSNEKDVLKSILLATAAFDDYKALSVRHIHYWAILAQLVTENGETLHVPLVSRLLQLSIPLIDDYFSRDPSYSEDLLSMCLSLLHHLDRVSISNELISALIPLGSTAITGIRLPGLSVSSKVTSYTILTWVLHQMLIKESRKELGLLLVEVKALGSRLMNYIFNDALLADSSACISAIVLLDTLTQATSYLQSDSKDSNFVIDSLCTSPTFLPTLLKKLEVSPFRESTDSTEKVALLLLIRVAQTRRGAQQLVHLQLFSTLNSSPLLNIDPDTVLDPSTCDSALCFLVPIFRLIDTTIITLGPQNDIALKNASNLLCSHTDLIRPILKSQVVCHSSSSIAVTKELASLIVLLHSLVI